MSRPSRPSSGLRTRLVEGPTSVAARFRANRWARFSALVPDLENLHVVDLGGRADTWLGAPRRPASVTLVNLEPVEVGGQDWLSVVTGDACDPATFGDRSFDLVFSNSLVEHVGGFARRRALADNIRRLAPRHWVQTPYRYFPVEPHWVFPGMQFLPLPVRISVARWWPLDHTHSSDAEEAAQAVLWTELIGAREMRLLFPESVVAFERVAGVPKSLLAYTL